MIDPPSTKKVKGLRVSVEGLHQRPKPHAPQCKPAARSPQHPVPSPPPSDRLYAYRRVHRYLDGADADPVAPTDDQCVVRFEAQNTAEQVWPAEGGLGHWADLTCICTCVPIAIPTLIPTLSQLVARHAKPVRRVPAPGAQTRS